MEYSYLIIIAGASVAGFVQGLSGFAFGLVAMSFWAWVAEPHMAAAMAVFGALTGQIVAAFSVRPKFNIRILLPYLAGGLAGIPLGLILLPMMGPYGFRAALGCLLAVWCPLMLFQRHLPGIRVNSRWADAGIGWLGGAMSGLGGFSGAIPTLWCSLRQLPKDEQRAIIQNFNLSILTVTMAGYVGTGAINVDMWPLFAVIAPAVLICSFLGTRLYLGISDLTFRRIVLTLLTLSGVTLLSASLPHLFG